MLIRIKVIYNFESTKVCSPAIFETYVSYDKDIWIAAIDYYLPPGFSPGGRL